MTFIHVCETRQNKNTGWVVTSTHLAARIRSLNVYHDTCNCKSLGGADFIDSSSQVLYDSTPIWVFDYKSLSLSSTTCQNPDSGMHFTYFDSAFDRNFALP